MTHTRIEPGILYFGTPVVLISTRNEDGSANLAPMSSAFWLGWRGVLGLGARSKTSQNMLQTGECVHPIGEDGGTLTVEVRIVRVQVHDDIRLPGTTDRIDPDRWRPLIMSFQQLYGLGPRVHPSTLVQIPNGSTAGPTSNGPARRRRSARFRPVRACCRPGPGT